MNIDKLISKATSLTVGAVALFAAIVSYSHLYGLAALNHEAFCAVLLPLSIDGLILASSLVLLFAARNKMAIPSLARLMLWLGIGATILGNIFDGLGWTGPVMTATISAWPALAFVLVVETVLQVAKARRVTKPELVPVPVKQKAAKPKAAPKPTRPKATRPVDSSKVPGILAIRAELKCGQPKATAIQRIMREQHLDLAKAAVMWEEMKKGVQTPSPV